MKLSVNVYLDTHLCIWTFTVCMHACMHVPFLASWPWLLNMECHVFLFVDVVVRLYFDFMCLIEFVMWIVCDVEISAIFRGETLNIISRQTPKIGAKSLK
jgi:hypothetical protein